MAHNTKVGYNVTVNTLKNYKLGYMEIGKIRPEHCEEWLADMRKKYRGSSNENPDNPIRKFEPHICRHTFVTNMQYLPPKTLQYILGHGSISTSINNYVDVKPGNEQLLQINNIANQLIIN